MNNATMNQYTSKNNTYLYTCQAITDHKKGTTCGRKYSVGEIIVTGTLSREQLASRGGRRAGYCHCGARFATEFGCTMNAMWSLKVDGEEQVFFPRRSLERVPVHSDRAPSPEFLAMKQRMGTDPEFAQAVRKTVEETIEGMQNSSLVSVRRSALLQRVGIRNLSMSECDELLRSPRATLMKWYKPVLSRKKELQDRLVRKGTRGVDNPGRSSHVSEILSHLKGTSAEVTA
jgi:hypothetical protein